MGRDGVAVAAALRTDAANLDRLPDVEEGGVRCTRDAESARTSPEELSVHDEHPSTSAAISMNGDVVRQ